MATHVTLANGKSAYVYEAALTAVATTGVAFDKLPPGVYDVYFYGTHTNASTVDTLSFQGFIAKGSSTTYPITGGLYDDTSSTPAINLEVAKTSFAGVANGAGGLSPKGVGIPIMNGAKMVYAAQGASAVNISVVFAQVV